MQNSIASSTDLGLDRRVIWIVAFGGLVASAIYLIASWQTSGFGFPLDDSWIHLAFARNLAELGQWAFLPGQPSAASTAPLWTALLAPGFLLHLGPHIWTYLLGIGCLIGLGVVTESVVRKQVPTYRPRIPWAGLLMVTEWHFVWAAVSGMETLLYILLAIVVFGMLLRGSSNFLGLGVLIGLTVWVRPDAVTLLAPAGLAALLGSGDPHRKVRSLLLLGGGFAALVLPYILMNLALNGRPFPNTFYAKQAEYSYWRLSPLSLKLENLSLVFLGGIALVLLPAVVAAGLGAVRARHWPTLLALAWAVGYTWLYASRLPVYQHGRYIMPAMAVYILIGLIFLTAWAPAVRTRLGRLLRFTWLSSLSIVSGLFFIYGATVYASDVGNIENGMVLLANWVAENIPEGKLVAAHDIGALGYFAPHIRLIDLAGLASPEVVPFINDEERLADYLRVRHANYLVIPIEHYPKLAQLGPPVFTTRTMGMAVLLVGPGNR